MQKIIASYLVQKKECGLPGLGHFKFVSVPALHDIAAKQILPPSDRIFFDNEGDHLRNDFVEYVAAHHQINESDAADSIHMWCDETSNRLAAGEKIYFDSLGWLLRNPAGEFHFENDNEIEFFEPVPAQRVIHKNDDHVVLVGDRETTTGLMNQFFNSPVEGSNATKWRMWALILLGLALLVLIIHFSTHSFSLSGTGFQSHPAIQEAPATYESR